MVKHTRTKRAIAKAGARMFEGSAFLLDIIRFPIFKKQHNRFINRLYRDARWLSKYAGEQPKKYKRIVARNKMIEM